jgi:hypothetical protein
MRSAAAACVLAASATAARVVFAAPNPPAPNALVQTVKDDSPNGSVPRDAAQPGSRATAADDGFKPVGNTATTYDGGILLTVAYMVFFLLLFAWIASLWLGQARIARKADALDAKLDKLAHAAATPKPSPHENPLA